MDARSRTGHTCAMARRSDALLIVTAAIALASVVAVTSLASFWAGLVP